MTDPLHADKLTKKVLLYKFKIEFKASLLTYAKHNCTMDMYNTLGTISAQQSLHCDLKGWKLFIVMMFIV